jgi:hypothetical protein
MWCLVREARYVHTALLRGDWNTKEEVQSNFKMNVWSVVVRMGSGWLSTVVGLVTNGVRYCVHPQQNYFLANIGVLSCRN